MSILKQNKKGLSWRETQKPPCVFERFEDETCQTECRVALEQAGWSVTRLKRRRV